MQRAAFCRRRRPVASELARCGAHLSGLHLQEAAMDPTSGQCGVANVGGAGGSMGRARVGA
eukprot:364980-Chlamydomonas_euryale.AAC.10